MRQVSRIALTSLAATVAATLFLGSSASTARADGYVRHHYRHHHHWAHYRHRAYYAYASYQPSYSYGYRTFSTGPGRSCTVYPSGFVWCWTYY